MERVEKLLRFPPKRDIFVAKPGLLATNDSSTIHKVLDEKTALAARLTSPCSRRGNSVLATVTFRCDGGS